MKKILLGVLAITLAATISAATRTIEEAAAIAAQFTNQQPELRRMNKAPRTASNMRLAHTAMIPNTNNAAFYVFNQDDAGAIFVSADDRTSIDILGYLDEGQFDIETANPTLKLWLERYAKLMTRLSDEQPAAKRSKVRKAVQATTISPLLGNIMWNQDAPYYNLCPNDRYDGERCPTGCVATATAQIMRMYKWPATGEGTSSYSWNACSSGGYDNQGYCKGSTTSVTLEANYGATTYDWANMLEKYSGSYTKAQGDAVATLMYHCGVACEMDYASVGSGSWTDYMAHGLQSYFHYKVGKFLTSSSSYPKKYNDVTYQRGVTSSQIESALNSELEAGRPVLMGGVSEEYGGHEFVCDGRNSTGKFHFNFGWGGSGNGHFTLSPLGDDDYSGDLDALLGIEPDKAPVNVTGVSLNHTTLTMKINEKQELVATILPADASNKGVAWTSSNDAVATVSDLGKVKAVSAGEATITVTTVNGGKTATCKVTVTNEVMPGGGELVVDAGWAEYSSKDGWTVILYDETTEVPWVQFYFNSGAANKIVGAYDLANGGVGLWNDEDDANASISSETGSLTISCTGKDNGTNGCNTYKLAATFVAEDGYTYTLNTTLELCGQNSDTDKEIDMQDKAGDTAEIIKVTGVSVTPASATIDQKQKVQLTATITPSNASFPSVTWTSSKPAVASVDANGKVTGLTEGETTITATTTDGGFTGTAKITVTSKTAAVTDCDPYSYTFTQGVASSWQLGDYYWYINLSGTSTVSFDTQYGRGAQFGSRTYPATYVNMDTDDASTCLISDVIVNACVAAQGKADLTVRINDEDLGTQALSTTSTDYVFKNTKELQGKLEIELKNGASKAMYIKYIKTNSDIPSDLETVPTTDNKRLTTKIIENGQLFIIVDGIKYNIFGQTIE